MIRLLILTLALSLGPAWALYEFYHSGSFWWALIFVFGGLGSIFVVMILLTVRILENKRPEI